MSQISVKVVVAPANTIEKNLRMLTHFFVHFSSDTNSIEKKKDIKVEGDE